MWTNIVRCNAIFHPADEDRPLGLGGMQALLGRILLGHTHRGKNGKLPHTALFPLQNPPLVQLPRDFVMNKL